jgi:excisionase family DNA binding protein
MSKQQRAKNTVQNLTDMGKQTDVFFTVEQAANLLGLAEKTVRQYASAGELKAYKRAGRWYIFQSDLAAFVRGEWHDE